VQLDLDGWDLCESFGFFSIKRFLLLCCLVIPFRDVLICEDVIEVLLWGEKREDEEEEKVCKERLNYDYNFLWEDDEEEDDDLY